MTQIELRDKLANYFNMAELNNLCFDLGINYENLAGTTLTDKARELVAYCNRLDKLPELLKRCKKLRPTLSWPSIDDIGIHKESSNIHTTKISNSSLHSMFDEIVSIDNLRKSWIKALNHAQTEDVFFDHYGYQQFEKFIEANLTILQKDLISGAYSPEPLRFLTIPKDDKVRKIYFTSPRDTVAIQAVINVIGPLFEQRFSDFSFGHRLAIDAQAGGKIYKRWQGSYSNYVTTVRSFLNSGKDAWYLITDIENFYPSIDRQHLRGLIATIIRDEQTLHLINKFLELSAFDLKENIESITGLPPGAAYAHFFANIYLMEFDTLAQTKSLGYARYVDDVCMVFSNLKELEKGEEELSNYLRERNHDFKQQKTERWAVKDWEVLIEHTQKMKYATRLDFIELLDLSEGDINAARDAEQYFKQAYRLLDKEGSLERLINESASILIQLHNLGAGKLEDLIYSLLESVPLKPSTLRIALSILLEHELPNLSQKFNDFFARDNSSDYMRLNLLQILPFFAEPVERLSSLKPLLLSEFAQDNSYLVRANTYTVLRQLADKGSIDISNSDLRELRQNEEAIFAIPRLIECYAGVHSGDVWASLISLTSSNVSSVQSSVVNVFLQLLDDGKISPSEVESFLPVFDITNQS